MPETIVIINKYVNQMKKIVLVIASFLIAVSGFAQKTADIGIWGGTSTYIGDVNDVAPFQAFNPNFGAFFRYNFNPRIGLRTQFLTGKISAEGTIQDMPWNFEKSVQDLSLQVEINFLKYRGGEKKTPFSPYLLGGIGVMYYPYEMDPALIYAFNQNHNKGLAVINESVVALSLPFGMGVKTHLGERLGIGVEYLMRKHFVDQLDNLDDPNAFINSEGKETVYNDFFHNNDWSGYLGVYLTYKLYLGKEACPAYDKIYR